MKQIKLFRKIYFWNPSYPAPVDNSVLLRYKEWLLTRTSLSEKEREELRIVIMWINKKAVKFSDQDPEIEPRAGAFDAYIASLLDQIEAVMRYETEYVCLYHTLQVLGMQQPISFVDWVKWFNRIRVENQRPPILQGTAPSNISKYLKNPDNQLWVEADYLKQEGKSATVASNHFKRLASRCQELQAVILGNLPVDDLFN